MTQEQDRSVDARCCDNRGATKNDQARLERLAAFAPIFRDPKTIFGKWRPDSGNGTTDQPLKPGWFELSDVGSAFYEMVYDAGWVLGGFDWTVWARSPEGERLATSHENIASANCEQLSKLLTAVIRQDRFCEGFLESCYARGLLLAIAERAEALATNPAHQ
jgi:hypothetical protein